MLKLEKIYTLAVLSGLPSLANFILASREVPKVGTAATNGTVIFYNNDFIDALSTREALGVFAHEFYHIVYNHIERGKKFKAVMIGTKEDVTQEAMSVWNIAGDVIVNDSVVRRMNLPIPSIAIRRGDGTFKDLPDECNTTVKVYNWLLKNGKEMTPSEVESFTKSEKERESVKGEEESLS